MLAHNVKHLGSRLRDGVVRNVLGGNTPSNSIHSQVMMSSGVAAGPRQKFSESTALDEFKCNLSVCGDATVCGE